MIFNLFKPKSKLGVDIGTFSIKIVELSKQSGRFALENYGSFELDSSSQSQESAGQTLRLPDQDITWGIKQVVSAAGMKSRDAVAAIPSFSTFSTVIEMPYLSETDLAKAIPFEARKYIPIPLNEVVLDWSIIGVVEQAPGSGKTPTVEVFLAAVPKDETARYQRIMRDAGLNLVALELENAALSRALLGNDLSATTIVDVGGRGTSIVIMNKGYERVSHTYEIGSFEITKSIARSLNVSFEKAEELKHRIGLTESDENVIREGITSLLDQIIFETKKTITNYEESKNQKVGRVVAVGGIVNMPNFVNYVKQKLGRDVYVGNVFSRVVYPPALEPMLPELSNTFAVATGLAMREV